MLTCVIEVPRAASPVAISIDFVGTATAMTAVESAGVVAKTNWNSVSGASRTTPLALKDETGAATGATITWIADNTWMTPITDQAGSRRLMKVTWIRAFRHLRLRQVGILQLSPRQVAVVHPRLNQHGFPGFANPRAAQVCLPEQRTKQIDGAEIGAAQVH